MLDIAFIRRCAVTLSLGALLIQGVVLQGQDNQVALTQDGSSIVLEPYAPNVIRVTVSRLKDKAAAPPGYGFSGTPSATGWKHEQTAAGNLYKSSRMVVTVEGSHPLVPTVNDLQLDKYFQFLSAPRAHITIATPEGKTLVNMLGWSMSEPNDSEGNTQILNDKRSSDEPFYRVAATFSSPENEHYYGLGQNQEGYFDYRGHTVNCWHDYFAPGGESVCVPFMVSSLGYGLVWDNPSRTKIEPGFNEFTKWTSEVGDRVSFFVIAGNNTDEIYQGYRLIAGATPMLPKAAYGFTQSKQRYDSQDEILGIAKGYRDRHLPADTIVVDFLYYTNLGLLDLDRAKWPDPEGINRQLHDMGFHSLI
jgi:alpha-D-xyloside xylohydrolase